MLKFGLIGLKTVCYCFVVILLLCGAYLLAVAIAFKTKWNDADHILGKVFTTSGDIAFYIGIVIVVVAVLGFLAIFYCKFRLLTLFLVLLVLLIPVCIICGFHLYTDGYSDYSPNHVRINAFIRGMSPIRLNLLQSTFHCCGIEKYTDYYLLWSIWAMNHTFLEPTAKTKKTVTPKTATIYVTPHGWNKTRQAAGYEMFDGVEFDPPTLDELDLILGYYQDPVQIEKYHTSKIPRLANRVSKINNWMNAQFTNLRNKLSKWIKVNVDYVQKYTPLLMVNAVKNFLRTTYNVYRFNREPYRAPLRWTYSSGWDEAIAVDVRLLGLPLSCCKNPKTIKERCLGLAHDTWRDGCRHVVPAYYQLKVYQFAIIILCLIPIIFLTIIVTYTYRAGLYEHYSF